MGVMIFLIEGYFSEVILSCPQLKEVIHSFKQIIHRFVEIFPVILTDSIPYIRDSIPYSLAHWSSISSILSIY